MRHVIRSPFPLTYDECRARFRQAAAGAGAGLRAHRVPARGPDGQSLTVDVARLGPDPAPRLLVLMSGTHGIEGFAGSAIQTEWLLARGEDDTLPADLGVVLVHAVNPYGMAWWRRQNESNVDLNRNWVSFESAPPENPGYRELHPFLCPLENADRTEMEFRKASQRLIDEHGYDWVKTAITVGQYEVPDGLYYGGAQREASTRILEEALREPLAEAEQVLTVDLHTGHGDFGTYTLLCSATEGSDEHRWLAGCFDPAHIEVTQDNPQATTPEKRGQLARGFRELLQEGARYASLTFELGTCDDLTMILAERAEHWLHRHGDREAEEGRRIAWRHRCASIPDSAEWESRARAHGRQVVADALRGIGS